jgi:hypothetical protein
MLTEEFKKNALEKLEKDSPEDVLKKLEDAIGVYSNYAFSNDSQKKAEINRESFIRLKDKYNILKYSEERNNEEYDIILRFCGPEYHSFSYIVEKNGPSLTDHELALICDNGNLCFGYTVEDRRIVIFTD